MSVVGTIIVYCESVNCRMECGGLSKLIIWMKTWWFIPVLLDIVDAFYNITVLEMCVILHTLTVILIDSASVREKVSR